MADIQAFAALEQGADLVPFQYDPGPLPADQVEISVTACGLCHSDVSMIDNDWGFSKYPVVPGHEAVGRIVARGENVTHLEIGQMVGIGWTAESCRSCYQCLSGSQHRCSKIVPTIHRHFGGFADRMRAQAIWAIPLPAGLDVQSAGPLFCGGITVFAPMIDYGLRPTDHIAIVGVGGLGHLAIQFAKAWGCEVTALTSNLDKTDTLKTLGAHNVINSRDEAALKSMRGRFDMVLSTVNVNLPWQKYIAALAPKGRLVHVGMVTDPMDVAGGQLIAGQKQIGGSDTGSPAMVTKMLEFCSRHNIQPVTEVFKMQDVNAAIAHLKAGKARYRIVLQA